MLNLIHTFAFKSYKNWLTTRQFNQDGRMQIDDIELLIFQFVTLYLEMRYCHFTVSIATWLKQVKWKYFITFLRMSKKLHSQLTSCNSRTFFRRWKIGFQRIDNSSCPAQFVTRFFFVVQTRNRTKAEFNTSNRISDFKFTWFVYNTSIDVRSYR